MIDFHNHILPGVDDGARTMQESLDMLSCAQDQGITDVVNTVHFQHPKMKGKNTDFKYISSVKNDLLEEMSKKNIKVNIHLGAEVFFDFNLIEILDNPLITFCNGKYMLIEFQAHQLPHKFDKHLYELAMHGVTPIIAHPERYKPIQEDMSIVEKLINSGCLMQIDGGSLLGHFGVKCKIAAITMLKCNMIHVIGSDSHRSGKRNFCLRESFKIAEQITNQNLEDLVFKNPNKIVNGEDIIVPQFISYEPPNILSRFFNKLIKNKKNNN